VRRITTDKTEKERTRRATNCPFVFAVVRCHLCAKDYNGRDGIERTVAGASCPLNPIKFVVILHADEKGAFGGRLSGERGFGHEE